MTGVADSAKRSIIADVLRLVLCAVSVCAMWLALEMVTAKAASAKEYTIHEWNICGNACNDDIRPEVNTVIYAASAEAPMFIALNEVCERQVWLIHERLYHLGYHTVDFVHVNTSNRVGGSVELHGNCGDRHGYAIWAKGSAGHRKFHKFSNNSGGSSCNPWTRTCRQIWCRSVNTPSSGTFAGCVTHLHPSNATARAQQNNEALYFASADVAWKGKRILVAGDFNDTPKRYSMDDWYSSMGEVHGNWARAFCEGAGNCMTWYPGKSKIDYIFGRTNMYVLDKAKTTYLSGVSDHLYLHGKVAW